MRRCAILLAASTVSASLFGGLFDAVTTGAASALGVGTQGRRQESGSRSYGRQDGNADIQAKASQIDAEIEASSKVPGVLGWTFGRERETEAGTEVFAAGGGEVFIQVAWRNGDNAALNDALHQWFSKVLLKYEPDGKLGTVRLEGNVEKLTDASRLSLYRILRWLEHDFGVVERQKAHAFLLSSDSYPHNAYFRTRNERYEAQLDSNSNTIFLQLRDESVRRDEQERMRKQAEEFAAQVDKQQQEEQERERQRKAEQSARAEQERRQLEAEVAERQRQREAARAERIRIAAEKEKEQEKGKEEGERIMAAERKRRSLLSCRDGSMRESFMIYPKDLNSIHQFPSKPIVTGKVPLYKSIASGSTLMWSLGQLIDFTGQDAFGAEIKMRSMENVGIDGFDYDGISVLLPKKKNSSDTIRLYCSSEDLEKSIETCEDESLDGVAVFGVGIGFSGQVAATDIMEQLKKKYANLKTTEKRWTTEDYCLDLVGLKRKAAHTRLEFANGDVKGIVCEEKCEFEKFDLDSPEASFMLYFSSLEALKRANTFAAEEFEQSFNSSVLQIKADVKNGKYKKDIARFKFGAGGIDDFKKGEQLTSETVFILNAAAKQVLSERSFSQSRKDAIKRGRAEMFNIQSELLTPDSQTANVLAAVPRLSVSMRVFDAKALESLPELKRKREEAKKREEQSRSDAQKADSLNF